MENKLIGKTIASFEWKKIEGEYGYESSIILHFTDGTFHEFVVNGYPEWYTEKDIENSLGL